MTIDEYIEYYKENGYINEMRKHVGHAPILTCACGVIVENRDGEILLQKRKDNGRWAIIGGSMEMGESFEETVRREAKEESGLTLGELNLFKLVSGRDRIIEYPNGDVVINNTALYCVKNYTGEVKWDSESKDMRFFDLDNLPENQHDPDLVEAYIKFINKKNLFLLLNFPYKNPIF